MTTKIVAVLTAMVTIALAASLLVYARLDAASRAAQAVAQRHAPMSEAAYEMEINVHEMGLHVLSYVDTGDRRFRELVRKDEVDFHRFRERYGNLAAGEAEQGYASRMGALFLPYRSVAVVLLGVRDRRHLLYDALEDPFARVETSLEGLQRELGGSGRTAEVESIEAELFRLRDEIDRLLLGADPQGVSDQLRRLRLRVADPGLAPGEGPGAEDAAEFRESFGQLESALEAFLDVEWGLRRNIRSLLTLRSELDDLLDDQIQTQAHDSLAVAEGQAQDELEEARSLLLGLIACFLVIGAAAAAVLTRAISTPVRALTSGARAIGSGQLDHRVEIASSDEFADLAAEFNEMAVRLEELDRTKADFVATISHELRTPLTSMMGYAELLAEGAAGPLNSEQARLLRIVDASTRRLFGLIEDLLTVSRIESGSFSTETEVVELLPLLERAREQVLPLAAGRDVDLEVEGEVGPLRGDAHQLEQVLGNLLSNAVKFSPPGGRVRVTARRRGEAAAVTVSDSGMGIPLEEQGQLFTRFFRTAAARQQAIPGTGLGLVIVKTIVEQHGGDVELVSAPGKGTRVTFTIPLAHAARSPERVA